MLTKKAKYALNALSFIYRQSGHEYIGIVEIAKKQKIPRKFLEAILLKLNKHRILVSKRGKGGGYALNKGAETVSIGHIIRIMDGTLALSPCASQTAFKPCQVCLQPDSCAIKALMVKVREATAEILELTTLRDISEHHSELLYMI
jgi:Rrf2 family protein